MEEVGGMKKRHIALAVIVGAGIALIVLLFSLDLHLLWDKVCDAFT